MIARSSEKNAFSGNESEIILNQIFRYSPAFMAFMRGPNYVFEKANEKYCQLFGSTDIIGKEVGEVFPETYRQSFTNLLNNIYKTKLPYSDFEVPLVLKDRKTQTEKLSYFDFIHQPVLDKNEEVLGIATQGYDVTEKVLARKAVENSKFIIEVERENFKNLFRQTPEMVCILSGPDHVFEFVNDAHVKVLGFDATGKSVREAQPESDEVHGILDEVYRTGKTAELFEIPVTLGDRIRYFNLTYAARRSSEGVINGIMILGTEITEDVLARNAIQESQERYRLLFDNSPLPKWIFDIETLKFIDVNEAAVLHYGYSKEEFLSMRVGDIRPTEDLERFDAFARSHYCHIKKDRSLINVEISSQELFLNGRKAQLAAIVDVTDRVRAEQKQKDLIQSLHIAKLEAEKANELKSSFLANMSHEIRTPLGAMMGFSDLLRDRDLSETERLSHIEILRRNGEQLSFIINDILDLSKVEAGHLALDFVDAYPHQITKEVISLLQVKAREKNIKLEIESEINSDESVISDPNRIRQILVNILGNAVKFTHAGKVKVRIFNSIASDGHKTVNFEVNDTGIGIPINQIDQVFEMFVQADGSMTRCFGGTGLGLALSRRLAQALGGDVKILSTKEGVGTTFLITIQDFPERKELNPKVPHQEAPSERSLTTSSLEGVSVLVVDDAPDNQQMIKHYLIKYGATVGAAENGLEGYKKALNENYDIILMDIQMPIMDGYSTTQKLRDHGYRKPIIALTAHAMTEVRKKCLNVGCTDHLAKPIDSENLIKTVLRYTQEVSNV